MTYKYSAPERLERDWEKGAKTPPGEMLAELEGDIQRLRELVEGGQRLVPVQGRVSDYKSWLAAATAMRLADTGMEVTVFAPQRTNRESAVHKLRRFGAELIEHPGRLDLCVWEPWRENAGHVDKATCEAIGCPYYLDSRADIEQRTAEAVGSHTMRNGGGLELDAGEMKRLGERQDFCPAQLYLRARGAEATEGAVNAATYAKAFADAAISDDDPLDSDVLLLDEAHTVAADPGVVTDDLEPDSLLNSIEALTEHLGATAERWARSAHREMSRLRRAVERWLRRSRHEHVEPDGVFDGGEANLPDAFDTLDRVDGRVMQTVRRRIRNNDWEGVGDAAGRYLRVEAVRGFLSRVKQYRGGRLDFVHSRYERDGHRVNEMAFRGVDESINPDEGTTPGAVFREWRQTDTHPAVRRRWGPILDRYIESLWEGRALHTTNGLPGAPATPMDRLRGIAGADTTVTLSATHNELSDPTRPPDSLRPTRHALLCAPVNLRAEGSQRRDYDGNSSVTPETPWFQGMVESAKRGSGDALAAVPINHRNAPKWEAMPVESIENDDGDEVPGVVPNSRGAIGEKGLERLDIDTVLCGVQVQGPAPTARRLIQWWEILAPRYGDPAEALAVSWRLLAQHAVSGTIQAGGRFDWGAVNLVFERPGLFELAGFEAEEATPDSPGFAGEFARIHEQTHSEWAAGRGAARAAKTVDYLAGADRKTASIKQTIGQYRRAHGAGGPPARRALRLACRRGRVGAERTDNGLRFKT